MRERDRQRGEEKRREEKRRKEKKRKEKERKRERGISNFAWAPNNTTSSFTDKALIFASRVRYTKTKMIWAAGRRPRYLRACYPTKVQEKLNSIKVLRNQKLQETDFYALSDVTMSSEMSTYRQKMRDLPQDFTTESEYDTLLARDENGNLTHTVWSKP